MNSASFFQSTIKRRALIGVRGKGDSCFKCGLWRHCRSPMMKAYGDFGLEIQTVGEGPGGVEDRRGRQWQGPMGELLQDALGEFDIDLFRDCSNINAVNCRPVTKDDKNRAPTNKEIAACRSRVIDTIVQKNPKLILGFGNSAVLSLLGYRWKKDLGKITRWRGWVIPDRDFNAWLCFTFHPSYVGREEKEVRTVFMQDLAGALSYLKKPLPKWEDERRFVEIVDDLSFLEGIEGPAAIDYETTGLKPHDLLRHAIICIAVCDRFNRARVFKMPEDEKNLKRLRRFLCSHVAKIAANMKFEHTWSRNILGYWVNGWMWDTMLAAHVLDNRQAICGLKFQTYVNFGVADYDSGIHPYLETKKKGGNAVNRVKELVDKPGGLEKLLVYCGLDTIYTYRLAVRQMKKLGCIGHEIRA